MLWFLAGFATIVALLAFKRASALSDRLDDLMRETSSRSADSDEIKTDLEVHGRFIERLAAGHDLDAIQVREKRLYRNVKGDDLAQRMEGGAQLTVIDVRTDQEWKGGHIEGALHIPVDGLESGMHAVPRDGRELYAICAGGGRSASAAEFLAKRGYLNVHNVEGGMNGWRGATVQD